MTKALFQAKTVLCVLVGTLLFAALIALGTTFAVADDGATGGSGSSSSADTGSASGGGGTSGTGSDTGGGPSNDPDPGGGTGVEPGDGSDNHDIYDGQIIDYNQDALTLSISMATGYVTLEQGQSTSVSCVIDPHQGLLVTEKNGTFVYDTTAYATCSDPSVVRATYDLYSDTLYLEAFAPGTVVVTVGANLVYADPVSASLTVEVPEPPWDEEDEYVGDGEDCVKIDNVLYSGASVPAPAPDGDLDGSGDVTVADAITALRISMGLLTPSELQLAHGDLDGDGSIGLTDSITVLRITMDLVQN